MKHSQFNCIAACFGYLLAAMFCEQLAAEAGDGVDVEHQPVAAELNELGSEYERLAEAQLRATPADGAENTDDNLSDEQWLAQGRAIEAKTPDPDRELLPRLLEFAERHPESPFALDALCFVIRRGGPQTGDVHGKPWQTKEQALDIVFAQHMDDPRVVVVFDLLGGSLPSRKSETFLREAMENGPDRTIQAAAAFHLARSYHTLGRAHTRSQQIKQMDRLLNFERFWKLVVTPYLEQNFPPDEERNSAEVESLLARVIDEYSDVPAMDWKLSGPSKVFLQAVPFSEPKTYGNLAKSMVFELSNIVPGKPAPDIEGTDADGNRFRLSDYRGKVVLLTFSADWCGSCVALYPLERALVEKYRDQPFVMLSVSRDEKIDTLQSAIASGEITWRCWWDGMYGPIRNAWNSPGIPRIVLLDDQHVFQDVAFSRYSSQAEFELAIDELLRNVPAKKMPSP